MIRLLAFASLCCVLAARAESSSHSILLGGQYYQMQAGRGGAQTLDWVYESGKGTVYSSGFGNFALAETQWRLGRAGIARKAGGRLILGAQASLGSGRTGPERFPYRVLEAKLDYLLAPRVFAKAATQHFHVAGTRGFLSSFGALFPSSRSSTLDVTYNFSPGGNLRTRFFAARHDRHTSKARFFGGAATGRTSPVLFNLGVGSAAGNKQLRQFFLGSGIPLHGAELILSFELIRLNSVSRSAFAITFKIPISRDR